MQHFKTKDGEVFAYDEDEVIDTKARTINGVHYSSMPSDLEPFTPTGPSLEEQLRDAKEDKIEELNKAFQSHVSQWGPSDALGEVHLYPSDSENLSDMANAVTASQGRQNQSDWTIALVCSLPDKVNEANWPMVEHNATQAQEAFNDLTHWLSVQKAHIRMLRQKVLDITEDDQDPLESVNQIVWSDSKT